MAIGWTEHPKQCYGPIYHLCPVCGHPVWEMGMIRPQMIPWDQVPIDLMFDREMWRMSFGRPVFTADPCGHSWEGQATLSVVTLDCVWHEAREVDTPIEHVEWLRRKSLDRFLGLSPRRHAFT